MLSQMYLKSLELTGFKSFAKKATLSFTSPITGIVGPNGSGKSNVAEAFRFALGEQSIKSLRGKRGEDLIWNGGGEGPTNAGRANRAAIKLTFDNSRRIFPSIDFDEVAIERVVHRDSTNEYLLNGSQVRLRDIVELLAGAHIGATGHHIISQGEADRILSASIRERREMIEDALGLKVYQWKKLESLRKLEKTEENMKQVESLRREIAPHLRFLKKQVEKVEKAVQLRVELIALYKQYFSVEDNFISKEKARITHALSGPTKELADLDQALSKAKEILTASNGKDQKSDEIIALEDKLSKIRTERDILARELGRIEGEIAAGKRAIEKEKEKQKRDEFKTIYLKDLEDVVAGFEKATFLVSDIIDTLKKFISKHRTIADSSFITETETDIKKLAQEKEHVETKQKTLSQEDNELARTYQNLKQNIEKEKDTNRDAEKDVFRIIARQNEIRGIISALNLEKSAIERQEEAFKHELGEAGLIAGRDATDYKNVTQDDTQNNLTSGVNDMVVNADRLKQIEKIKVRLEDAGAGGGAEILKEYKETEERDVFLARELVDLEKAKEELKKLIEELNVRIDTEFRTGIVKINTEFGKFFTLMFGGGRAELTVVREAKRRKKSDIEEMNDALSGDGADGGSVSSLDSGDENKETEEGPEGLDVNISLPRKKVKGLMMLSGGERALTSIALLFAISQVNPPPFIILDETDAALDEANSKKYGDMIESLSRNSQLILITHNRETMSRAGVLYGVTMGSDGASRLLSIAFEAAVAIAK